MTDYQPDFDIDRRRGERGEILTLSIRERFANGSIEVKTDDRARQTGRVYIEHACLGRDGVWRNSGILTTKADCWAFVIGDVVIAAPVPLVRAVWQWARDNGDLAECSVGSNPTKGVVVPTQFLLPRLFAANQPERRAA